MKHHSSIKRAVVYARFSSSLQNENSCRDQIRLCTAWAERQGYEVVQTYEDQAVSGASTVNRFGLASLMRDAENGQFDIVICEALDRLSRDQADLGKLRKDLNFLDIGISTVQDGEVGAMHVGIKGLMGELYLADLSQKTRRGLQSVIKDGRQAGGKSYGYDVVAGATGQLSINEREAGTVRRIFAEYVSGSTPRQIAAGLNADHVPSPRGGKWNSSTINGSRTRQNGILQNQLYVGKTVWNRQRFIKNPATGKRVSRPNPETEWIISEAPNLRIIEDDLFEKAGTIKAGKGSKHSHFSRRPKHLLSGIVKCGECGASYTVIGNDRLGCAGFRERGDCSNNRTVTRRSIEDRVLGALQNQLADPELIKEYVLTYHAERKRLMKSRHAEADGKRRRLNEINTGIERIIDKVVDGTASSALTDRLEAMEAEKKALAEDLDSTEQDSAAIDMHPAAGEKYRRIVADLQNHMEDMESDDGKTAILEEVRRLIEKVIVKPTGERKPVALEVHGLLASLLSISGVQGVSEYGGLNVASPRNQHYPKFRFRA